jgi:hypothetical protein
MPNEQRGLLRVNTPKKPASFSWLLETHDGIVAACRTRQVGGLGAQLGLLVIRGRDDYSWIVRARFAGPKLLTNRANNPRFESGHHPWRTLIDQVESGGRSSPLQ